MPVGCLFVVATPIGNLEDITLRALRVLREVNLIAAEDTRRTAKLLGHFKIPTRTLSFHAHNSRARIPGVLAQLQAGHTIALVSDAGTPGISDPGVELVRACISAGIPVDPIPGPCAPICAAVVSGFPLDQLTVLGFAPARSKARNEFFEGIARSPGTTVFLETPHRVHASLLEASKYLAERPIMVAREVTKVHQEFLFGSSADLSVRLIHTKGELTVVVCPLRKDNSVNTFCSDESSIIDDFGLTTQNTGLNRREALRAVAKRHGVSAKHVYLVIESSKK